MYVATFIAKASLTALTADAVSPACTSAAPAMHSGAPSLSSGGACGRSGLERYALRRQVDGRARGPIAGADQIAPVLVRESSASRTELGPETAPLLGAQAFAALPMNVRLQWISAAVASTTALMAWVDAAHFDVQPVVHEASIGSFIDADVRAR